MKSEASTLKQVYSPSHDVISIFKINFRSLKIGFKRNSSPLAILVLISTFLLLIAGAFLVYNFQSDFEALHIDRLNSV